MKTQNLYVFHVLYDCTKLEIFSLPPSNPAVAFLQKFCMVKKPKICLLDIMPTSCKIASRQMVDKGEGIG